MKDVIFGRYFQNVSQAQTALSPFFILYLRNLTAKQDWLTKLWIASSSLTVQCCLFELLAIQLARLLAILLEILAILAILVRLLAILLARPLARVLRRQFEAYHLLSRSLLLVSHNPIVPLCKPQLFIYIAAAV